MFSPGVGAALATGTGHTARQAFQAGGGEGGRQCGIRNDIQRFPFERDASDPANGLAPIADTWGLSVDMINANKGRSLSKCD